MYKLLVVVLTCGVVVLAKLPPYIQKCSIKDPDIDSCVLKSARQAIPHLIKGDKNFKIPVLDPFFLSELKAASGGLDAAALNTTVVGLKDVIIEQISYDFEKKKASLQATMPSLNFTGNYRVSGKLGSLPMSGSGPFTTSLVNLTVNYKVTYDLEKLDDGEVYMIYRDFDCDLMPQHFQCRLENMFNGNKVLGEAINTFINQNWRVLYGELGKGVSLLVGQIVFNIYKEAAKTVPFREIFNDVE